MKNKIISKTFGLLVVGILMTSGFLANNAVADGGKKCRMGERCPSGTYKYCDDLASGDSCVCYSCKPTSEN